MQRSECRERLDALLWDLCPQDDCSEFDEMTPHEATKWLMAIMGALATIPAREQTTDDEVILD